MSSGCNDCFNNCSDIVSDQCVKYTGDDISSLGISNGDNLSTVEEKIADYLLTVMDGAGIAPTIDPSYICTLVDGYLPEDPTLDEIITALVRTACDLQDQITAVVADVATIEADYTIGDCLSGVTASSGTHDILQAVITELCSQADDITALQSSLSAYVKIADLDTYIAAYMAANVSTKYYTRMVPNTAVEYYCETLTGKFDLSGAGYGDWENIYLCNGQNGTPDKRGRIPVGCTSMWCVSYDADVDPGLPGNPTYDLLDTEGSNTVTLTKDQMPSHTHTASNDVEDNGHRHVFCMDDYGFEKEGYQIQSGPHAWDLKPDTGNEGYNYYTKDTDGTTNPQKANILVTTTVDATGGGDSHSNIPPVMACYYIIYLPPS